MRCKVALAFLLFGCNSTPPMDGFTVGKPPLKQPPANAVGGFSIQLPTITLQPGDEQLLCYIFPLAIDGPSRIVAGATLNTTPGLHHGNITARASTGTGFRACPADGTGSEGLDIASGGAWLFASSTQVSGQEWISFPPGMGYRVKDGFEIVARVHFLNATPEPLTIAPSYQWYTIDEASLTQELAPFGWVYSKFTIPAQSTTTVTGECTFPSATHPMHVVEVLPHMHKMGIGFDAGVIGGPLDGQDFLASPGYDPERGVFQQYDPAIDLSAVDGIRFGCTWHNPTDVAVGEGIGNNEMCMLFGYAWPPDSAWSALATQGSCIMSQVR